MPQLKRQPVRLYARAAVLGQRMSKRNVRPKQTLLKIEGATTKKQASAFIGKKVAYIFKGTSEKKGTKFRCIMGVVAKNHGTGGTVRAFFKKNLPPQAFGGRARVMLYPSSI